VTSSAGGPVVTEYEKVIEAVRKSVARDGKPGSSRPRWAKIISDLGSTQAGITGIDIKNEPAFRKVIELTSGRLEDLAEPNTMMVFESQVERLKVKVGDAVTLVAQTTRGAANTIDCRIVAIAKDMGLMSKSGSSFRSKPRARCISFAPTPRRDPHYPSPQFVTRADRHRGPPARTA